MINAKNCIPAAVVCVAFAAVLGLAGCGGGAATQSGNSSESSGSAANSGGAATSAASSAEAASAQGSSVEEYDLASAWVGMGDDFMAYYYEGASRDTGAVLVYYTEDNTYERWIGILDVPADNQRQVTDAESAAKIAFTITSEDADGTISIEADNGLDVSMSPTSIDEVGGVLDEVDAYATRARK